MADNALKFLEKYPDEIKYHGLWIVTSIYTTEKCSILMWHEEGKKVDVGFSADVTNIGSLKSDLEWYGASTDAGWSEYRSHVSVRLVVSNCSRQLTEWLRNFSGRGPPCSVLWRIKIQGASLVQPQEGRCPRHSGRIYPSLTAFAFSKGIEPDGRTRKEGVHKQHLLCKTHRENRYSTRSGI